MSEVCHIVASLNSQIGGPAVSVPALTDALEAEGVSCSIWTSDYPELGPIVDSQTEINALPITGAGKLLRGVNPLLKNTLLKELSRFKLVHSHGLWMSPNRYARFLATAGNMPLVVSPRGMVQPWSWDFHPIRKRIAWLLFERSNLTKAAGFHATSKHEAQALRKLGMRQEVAVIPNGILPVKQITEQQRQVILADFNLNPEERYCLFLSRIHPKKGLEELLSAWRTVSAEHPNCTLLIAGPDLNGHLAELRSRVGQFRDYNICYLGPADENIREVLFEVSSVFILPSHSENFGLVVGEALLRGLPVITTANTPWQFVAEENIGWLCEVTPDSIAETLSSAFAESAAALQDRGARGKKIIEERFSWQVIAKSMKQFYTYLLEGGTPPDCLYTGS